MSDAMPPPTAPPGAIREARPADAEAIVAGGAAEEVHRAEAAGPSRTARKALGFDELLAGDVELMKKRSRNYARRQLSWMRKMPDVHRIDCTDRDVLSVATEVEGVLSGEIKLNSSPRA